MKKPVPRIAIVIGIGAFMAAWAGIMYVTLTLLEWHGAVIGDAIFKWIATIGLAGFCVIILSLVALAVFGLIEEWDVED